MPRMTSNVPIDKDYLRYILSKTGISKRALAATIGRTEGYIQNALDRGVMQILAAELLCKTHDFDIDRFCPKPKPKQLDEPQALMSDDKTLKAFVETMMRIEQKLDRILKERI